MSLFNEPWIYWRDQCLCCKNANKTDSCKRNQKFMNKLLQLYNEYIGTCEFKCDYFDYDDEKYKKNVKWCNNGENNT